MKKLIILCTAIAAMTAGQMVFGQPGETMSASDSYGSNSGSYDSKSEPAQYGGSGQYNYSATPANSYYYTPARNCPLLFGGRTSNNYAGGSYVGGSYVGGSYSGSGSGTSGSGAQSDTLAGGNTLAGSYGFVGMETFGDMLGGPGGGGGSVSVLGKKSVVFDDLYAHYIGSSTPVFKDFYVTDYVKGDNGNDFFLERIYWLNDSGTDGGVKPPVAPDEPSYFDDDETLMLLSDSARIYFEDFLGLSGGKTVYDASNSWYEYNPADKSDSIQGAFQYLYINQLNRQAEISAALSQSLVGRIKITEDLSPIPQDRLIFNYNYFHNVPSGNMKFPINRFTPGFEKTFFNKLMSFEMRLPMAVTMDTNLKSDDSTSLRSGQVGDLTMTLKALLLRRNKFLMTGGMTITAPTGKDVKYYDVMTGNQMLQYNNDSCHLMPFVGGLWTPSCNWFHQAYLQVDVDTNGRSVATRDPNLGYLTHKGRAYDNTYLYGSVSSGRWLYRNDRKRSGLTGLNVIGELHWTRAVNSSKDVVVDDGNRIYRVGNFCDNFEMLNATIGTRAVFNQRTVLGLAYGTPLTRRDRQFDGELRLSLNHYF